MPGSWYSLIWLLSAVSRKGRAVLKSGTQLRRPFITLESFSAFGGKCHYWQQRQKIAEASIDGSSLTTTTTTSTPKLSKEGNIKKSFSNFSFWKSHFDDAAAASCSKKKMLLLGSLKKITIIFAVVVVVVVAVIILWLSCKSKAPNCTFESELLSFAKIPNHFWQTFSHSQFLLS